EWRSLILFGLHTGQRLYDLAELTWDNVDLLRDEIRFEARKTGRRLILPIAPPLRRHLESLPQGDTPGAPLHPLAYEAATTQGNVATLSTQFVASGRYARRALTSPSIRGGNHTRQRCHAFHSVCPPINASRLSGEERQDRSRAIWPASG